MITQIRMLVSQHVHNIIKLVVTRDKCNRTMVAVQEIQWGTTTEIIKTASTIPRCSTTPNRQTPAAAIDPIKVVSLTTTEVTPTFHHLANSITCITFLIFIQKTVTIYTASQKME